MTPTVRCAALLALVAILAIVLPIWATLGGAIAVLVAAACDAWTVRRAPRLCRRTGTILSRGVAEPLVVRILDDRRRRVLLRQPAADGLTVKARAEADGLGGELRGLRRGRHELPGVASASAGPLGLARWHHPAGQPAEVLVYPDMHQARHLVLRLRHGRTPQEGRLRRGPLGLGTDFEAVREYSPGDDVRQVNWRATARLGRPMTNQYRVERDRDVVCLLDTGRLTAAPIDGGTLLDACLDAVAAVALVADEIGDRCGAVAFAGTVGRVIAPRRLGGRQVVHALFDVRSEPVESDFERAFLHVGAGRRACVIVLTDLIDEAAARSFLAAAPMLVRRHAVIVAAVSDPGLDATLSGAPRLVEDVYAMASTLDVLSRRTAAARRIRRTGAAVVQAPAHELPACVVAAYLRAKSRVAL